MDKPEEMGDVLSGALDVFQDFGRFAADFDRIARQLHESHFTELDPKDGRWMVKIAKQVAKLLEDEITAKPVQNAPMMNAMLVAVLAIAASGLCGKQQQFALATIEKLAPIPAKKTPNPRRRRR